MTYVIEQLVRRGDEDDSPASEDVIAFHIDRCFAKKKQLRLSRMFFFTESTDINIPF
jgi:hypothetical protein